MIYLASDFDGLIISIMDPTACLQAEIWTFDPRKILKLNLTEHFEYLSTARRHFWHNSDCVFLLSVALDLPVVVSMGNFVVNGNEEFVTLLENDFV